MTLPSNSRAAGTNEPSNQPGHPFDAWIVDEEFDDALDLELAALRETLSDSRYF